METLKVQEENHFFFFFFGKISKRQQTEYLLLLQEGMLLSILETNIVTHALHCIPASEPNQHRLKICDTVQDVSHHKQRNNHA